MPNNILRAKCIVAGDCAVGKTSVVHVFKSSYRSFPKNYAMTHGVDLGTRSVNIPDTNTVVELYLYDSSGKDVYMDSLLKYWEKPGLVVVVYDVTSSASFQSCENWLKLVKSLAGDANIPGVLLGNKTDQDCLRVVTPKVGQELAQKLGLQYFECSAKDMKCVEEPFFYLANEWYKISVDQTMNEKDANNVS